MKYLLMIKLIARAIYAKKVSETFLATSAWAIF